MTLWHSIYCSTQASLSFTVSRSLLTFFPANDESVLIQDGYWSILSAIQCPLSWWCYLTVLSSATPFFFCLQSFPASGTFPMSQFFASGGQSNGASASASVLPMNIQDWFALGLPGLIFLLSKELSRVFFSTTGSKASILWLPAFIMAQLSHLYMNTGKSIALTRQTFVSKVTSLAF